MNNCITLQDIDTSVNCQDNTGGLLKVLMMYHSDVKTWPTSPVLGVATTLSEMGKLVGDLVLNTGKKASVITLPMNKGNFTIEEIGETGGMSHQMALNISQDGMTPEVLGLMGATKNAKMVFVVIDNNQQAYLMGDKDVAARRDKGDGATTGTSRADLRSSGLKFIYPVNNPCVYAGETDGLLIAAL